MNLELLDGGVFGRVSIAENLGSILATSIRSLHVGSLGSAEIGGSLTGILFPHRAGPIHIGRDLVGQNYIDSGCILSDGRIQRIAAQQIVSLS